MPSRVTTPSFVVTSIFDVFVAGSFSNLALYGERDRRIVYFSPRRFGGVLRPVRRIPRRSAPSGEQDSEREDGQRATLTYRDAHDDSRCKPHSSVHRARATRGEIAEDLDGLLRVPDTTACCRAYATISDDVNAGSARPVHIGPRRSTEGRGERR